MRCRLARHSLGCPCAPWPMEADKPRLRLRVLVATKSVWLRCLLHAIGRSVIIRIACSRRRHSQSSLAVIPSQEARKQEHQMRSVDRYVVNGRDVYPTEIRRKIRLSKLHLINPTTGPFHHLRFVVSHPVLRNPASPIAVLH